MSLLTFDIIEKYLCGLMGGHYLPYRPPPRKIIVNLSWPNWQMLQKVHSLVPTAQTFTAKNCLAMTTGLNHPYSFFWYERGSILKVLPRITIFWNRLHECSFEYYNFNLFMYRVNCYLATICSIFTPYNFLGSDHINLIQ